MPVSWHISEIRFMTPALEYGNLKLLPIYGVSIKGVKPLTEKFMKNMSTTSE